MEGKESLAPHPGSGREGMPAVWEVPDGIRAPPSPVGMGIKGSREMEWVVLFHFLLVWCCHV